MRGLTAAAAEAENAVAEVEVNVEFLQPALTAPKGVLPAAIPPDYVANDNLRLTLYRRLFALSSEARLEDFRAELRDRFGPLPEAVANLLELSRCRILAAAADCRKLNVADGVVALQRDDGGLLRRNGMLPRLDARDPAKLRLLRLYALLREAVSDRPTPTSADRTP